MAETWKLKKQKKQKIFATSYIGYSFATLLAGKQYDFIRFDLNETARVYGYGSGSRMTLAGCDFLLRNVPLLKQQLGEECLFVTDIPYSMVCDVNAASLIVDFVSQYDIDAVNLRLNHNILPLAKKLVLSGMPVIITIDPQSLVCSPERIIENAVEAGNTCAVLMIADNIPDDNYEKIRSMCKIPVITDKNLKNADGYYAAYTDIIGMSDSQNKYLNVSQLIGGAIDDAAESINIR